MELKKTRTGDQLVVEFCGRLDTYSTPDTEEEMSELSSWVAGLQGGYGGKQGKDIPLHVTRFFPRFHMQDRAATEVERVYAMADIARQNLRYVYTGNC